MKKIFIIISASLAILINYNQIYAFEENELLNEKQVEFVYDMNNNSSMSFEYHDETGPMSVKIEKLPNTNRTITNGRYKISTSRQGSWSASFQVSIKDYKMISAGNSQATAITGSFISKNLKIDNSTTTTYYLKRKVGIIITNIYLRAQIDNKTLKVIVK